jgi:hypothetical protein
VWHRSSGGLVGDEGVTARIKPRRRKAWEAAVLPLNYARKPLKLLNIPKPLARFPLSNPCQLNPWPGSYIAILMPANALQEHDLAKVGRTAHKSDGTNRFPKTGSTCPIGLRADSDEVARV